MRSRASGVLIKPVEQTGSARGRGVWARLRRHPIGLIALGVLVFIYLSVFLGPIVYSTSPDYASPGDVIAPPSSHAWLGTDELGRDELARLLHGGRVTLTVSLVAILVAMTLGSSIGALAGYFRGWVETVLMRLVDTFMAIPTFFLVLTELTVFGNSPPIVVLVVGLSFWSQVARVMFAEFVKYRNLEFVDSARALGASSGRIIVRHIFPQVLPSAITLTTLGIGWSILTETGLSYLGLGIQPPTASWGNMLQNSQSYMWTSPVLAVYPGVMIAITVLSFNLLGNALRDILDPRNQERRKT